MRNITCVIALFTILGTSAFAAESGPVAHYAFDEGSGTAVRDISGNGNDGVISGGVEFVPRGDGYALQFDGKTGKVDIPSPKNLALKGDVTIEAWVKSSNTTGDDQLIFGDPAGLSIDRNILLFNSKGILRLDYGDGARAGYLMTDTQVFKGEWQHVAFMTEFPNFYIYLNGNLIKRGTMSFDITPTKGMSRLIGGWWAGHFDGCIDDLRIYNRALSRSEVLAHAGFQREDSVKMEMDTRVAWATREMIISVILDGIPAGAAKLRIGLEGSDMARLTKDIPVSETRSGSGRASATAAFKPAGMKAGDYLASVILVADNGSILAGTRKDWKFGGVRPWVDSKAGVTDKVLPPWTPVTVKQVGGAVDVGVWGRVYSFKDSLFPVQVTTAGSRILASPIRVVARVNGREVVFDKAALKLAQKNPAFVTLTATAQAGGLTVSARHRIEYDGLVTTDWSVASNGATVESLVFEIPFEARHGKYLYYCNFYRTPADPSLKVGELADGDHARSFNPFIWLGDEERGMQWVCESPVNWFNTDGNKAVRISRDSRRSVLRLNIIDKPTAIPAGKSLSYTFGLQASPVKPWENDCWDQRWASSVIVDYGHDYDLLTKTVDGMPVLDYYRKHGVKTILIMNWTDLLTYTHPLGQAENLRNLVSECHKRGIKLIPYFGYQINEGIPEWPDFGEDVIVKPVVRNPDRYPGMEPQMVECVCLRSVWKNFLVDTIARLMDEFDVDGIYLDSTVLPFPCMNTAHGCGYLDEDGTLKPDFAVFDIRDTLKRLYAVVKSRKPDGLVEVHPYDGMHLPALSYATSYWTGEQLGEAQGDDYLGALPLDRFRTDFMGFQWGIPAEFLHYKLGDYRKSFAFSLLHDVLVRPHGEGRESFDLLAGVWKAADDFGRKQAEWLPYWRNSEYARTNSEVVYCSLYKHPKNGILAVISNLDKQPGSVQVQFNLGKLSLAGKNLSAKDALTNEPVPLDSGTVSFDLPAVDWKLVWIH